ncbi:MAG: M23 family metallopeptidase [Elusimicrobiota bacterium]
MIIVLLASTCAALEINICPENLRGGEAVVVGIKGSFMSSYCVDFEGKRYRFYGAGRGEMGVVLPVGIEAAGPEKLEVSSRFLGIKTSSKKLSVDVAKRKVETIILKEESEKMRDAQPSVPSQQKSVIDVINIKSGKKLWDGEFILPSKNRIVTVFALKRAGKRYQYFHKGVDYSMKLGEPVIASNSGKVALSGENYNVYGNTIIIDHGQGIVTCYFHLSKNLKKEGERVKKGETIALAGSTGWSSGPHLHFAVYAQGGAIDPVWWSEFSGKMR